MLKFNYVLGAGIVLGLKVRAFWWSGEHLGAWEGRGVATSARLHGAPACICTQLHVLTSSHVSLSLLQSTGESKEQDGRAAAQGWGWLEGRRCPPPAAAGPAHMTCAAWLLLTAVLSLCSLQCAHLLAGAGSSAVHPPHLAFPPSAGNL